MKLYLAWPLFILPFFASPLKVEISNIQQSGGSVLVAVYNSEQNFLVPEKAVYKGVFPVSRTGSMEITLPDLPQGNYAISCFHDVNGNNELDTNLVGIPSEPYGFSNNARPKFRAPNWSETKFWYNGNKPSIRLEKW